MYRYAMIALLLAVICGCEKEEVPENPCWGRSGSFGNVGCINGYAFLFSGRGITQLFENTDKGVRAVQCVRRCKGCSDDCGEGCSENCSGGMQ
jgi:hypothetical protein